MLPESILGLDDWFETADLAEFRRASLGRGPVYVRPKPQLAQRLIRSLGLDPLERIFEFREPTVLAWMPRPGGGLVTAPIPIESARRFHAAGTTLYFKQVDEFADHEREVAAAFGVPSPSARCELFCNRAGATTVAHFDPVDIITVQLTGRKTWHIAPNTYTPLPMQPWAPGEPVPPRMRAYAPELPPAEPPAELTSYELEAGAVLHIPRGYWHATSSDEDSLSLHVLLLPPTRLDMALAALKAELSRDQRWLEYCYGLDDPDQQAMDRMAEDCKALQDAAARIDPRDIFRPSVDESRRVPSHFLRRGQSSFSVHEYRSEEIARIAVTAYGLYNTRTTLLDIDAALLPACRWINELTTGTTFAVADLRAVTPESPPEHLDTLIDALAGAHLVRAATAPA
ncbi:JmjC domain-containing protein [Nocardia sp. NPDC052566]|uniref:JmjC domain-containing protein n=1 Tax=Nocardia sp. NPDC052566 TaxID=3364330 RepID=UPI0037CA71E5